MEAGATPGLRDIQPGDLEGFEAVVHLAALSNDPIGDLNPALTYAINLDASIPIARSAREAGVGRFVFASSCSMYGAAWGDELVTEDAPLRPLTPYAESKVRAEEASSISPPRLRPVSMRNATAYGVSPRLRLDIVLNNLTAWAHTTGAIRLQSDGTAWRPLVHIEDISRAMAALLAAAADAVRGAAFNIGTAEQNYRIRTLAEIVQRRMPAARSLLPRVSLPTRAATASTSQVCAAVPGCSFDGPPNAAPTSWRRRTRRRPDRS